MSSYEVLSIVAICLSSVSAVATVIVPLIINYKNNKLQAEQKYHEKADEEAEREYLQKVQIIDEFNNAYASWLIDKSTKSNLILTLYKLSIRFKGLTSKTLIKFADLLLEDTESNNDYTNNYNECLRYIFDYLGITNSPFVPKQSLITDSLRRRR